MSPELMPTKRKNLTLACLSYFHCSYSFRYDTRDDFTVVIQPFFEQTKTPRNPDGSVDMSYFAPDCFHFSEVGHRSAALALWNSMIEPVGKKRKR